MRVFGSGTQGCQFCHTKCHSYLIANAILNIKVSSGPYVDIKRASV